MRANLITSIQYRAVAKYLSKILIILALLQLAPIAVSLLFGEFALTGRYLTVSLLVLAFGILGNRLLPEADLNVKDALVLASLIYLLLASIMAAVWWVSGLPFLDALFESMSAVTTTGLSTIPLARLSPTMLFTRSFIQWIGGLGIVVLTISVLIGPGTTASRLFTVSLGETKISPSAITATKLLWRAYVVITLACFLVYRLCGMDFFQSLCHSMTTISTGGFGTMGEGFAPFPPLVIISSIIFMLLGAMNFNLFYPLYKAPMKIVRDVQLRTLLVCCLALWLLFFLGMTGAYPWRDALWTSAFQTISAQSTTGFSTMNLAQAPPLARLAAILAMVIGGSIGSTAGGIKIFRLIIFIRLLHLFLMRIHQPKEVVTHLRIDNATLSDREIEAAVVTMGLFGITVVLSVILFVAAGYDLLNALFEVVSATGTVGLSTGICGPGLPGHLKVVLLFDMWMGRLEILPFLVMLDPRTWVKWRTE
ncbi:MAG: TrkH family potassium uptake protein [bacterium]